MADESVPALVAQRLLGSALLLRRGENLVIETWNHTLPYAAACVLEARRLGAHPLLVLEDEATFWRSIDTLPEGTPWARTGDHEWAANAKSQAYVFFPGPSDRPRLAGMPAASRRAAFPSDAEWYKRAARTKLRMVRSMLGYATEPQAARWGVHAAGWRHQLVQATIEPDPSAIAADAKRAAARLGRGRELRVTASNGTDLTLRLKGRPPTVDDGIVDAGDRRSGHPFTVSPPGTIAVAVDERSASGVAIANRPSFLPSGRVAAAQWELRDGRLTNYWYSEGQENFDAAYGPAPKGKDVLSVFSLGLNPSLAPGTPQVEDQEGGAVSLGIGGNHGFGGSNRSPFLSWIVIGEATVAVDGAPLCDRGKIL